MSRATKHVLLDLTDGIEAAEETSDGVSRAPVAAATPPVEYDQRRRRPPSSSAVLGLPLASFRSSSVQRLQAESAATRREEEQRREARASLATLPPPSAVVTEVSRRVSLLASSLEPGTTRSTTDDDDDDDDAKATAQRWCILAAELAPLELEAEPASLERLGWALVRLLLSPASPKEESQAALCLLAALAQQSPASGSASASTFSATTTTLLQVHAVDISRAPEAEAATTTTPLYLPASVDDILDIALPPDGASGSTVTKQDADGTIRRRLTMLFWYLDLCVQVGWSRRIGADASLRLGRFLFRALFAAETGNWDGGSDDDFGYEDDEPTVRCRTRASGVLQRLTSLATGHVSPQDLESMASAVAGQLSRRAMTDLLTHFPPALARSRARIAWEFCAGLLNWQPATGFPPPPPPPPPATSTADAMRAAILDWIARWQLVVCGCQPAVNATVDDSRRRQVVDLSLVLAVGLAAMLPLAGEGNKNQTQWLVGLRKIWSLADGVGRLKLGMTEEVRPLADAIEDRYGMRGWQYRSKEDASMWGE